MRSLLFVPADGGSMLDKAFASGAEPGTETLFDRLGVPVFQAFAATTRREAWQNGQRGLAPSDLAMHIVLPELDGRIMAGAIGFNLGSALLALSFGLVEVFLRCGLARKQIALAALLDHIQTQLSFVERQPRARHWYIF